MEHFSEKQLELGRFCLPCDKGSRVCSRRSKFIHVGAYLFRDVLHGPSMLADRPKFFGCSIFNRTFIGFEETSSF